MADVVAKRLGAILELKRLKANPGPTMHARLAALHTEHPWLLDWDRYVPIKKREAELRATATSDASKANAPAQLAALKDLNTLEELEAKYPEFKLTFPLPGGRRRRTGRGRRARGRGKNTRRR
jgi:hypothetical protein